MIFSINTSLSEGSWVTVSTISACSWGLVSIISKGCYMTASTNTLLSEGS